ncbi:MAG: TetR family transcriptional regulator [Alphaproteobacteria bacterium]|nr:TetR family transcriptional regulator [Alphaproteobacteria bacterium]
MSEAAERPKAAKASRRAWSGAIQGRSEQFELKRQVVLRTAARVFSERGFHQTTLVDIADELHISKPTLYHYFRSKDEILLEVQQMAIAQIIDVPLEPESGHSTGLQQLKEFVSRYISMIVDDFGTCLIMTGVLPLQPENRLIVRKGSKDIEKMMREILRRGVADGSIAPCDPKITAMLFFGAMNWVPYWYRTSGEIAVDGLVQRTLDFVLTGLEPRT